MRGWCLCPSTRWSARIAGAGLVVLCLAGCGGGDRDAGTAPSELEPYQAAVRVDPPEAHIGDRVTITIETRHPAGTEVLNARGSISTNFFVFDGVNPRETLALDGGRLTRQRFLVTYFELGEVQAASGHVVCIHPNAPDRAIAIPSQSVHFVSILTAGEQVLDLPTGVVVAATSEVFEARRSFFRETAETPWDRSSSVVPLWAWPLIMIGLGVLLLLLIVYVFRSASGPSRRRLRSFSAVQLARRELRALRGAHHAEEGRVGPFYVELSGIVRRYLERQMHLHAPEQTTEEFLHTLSRDDRLELGQKDLLGQFLHESDLVKFARATPAMGAMDEAFNAAERLVEETESKPAVAEETFVPGSLKPVQPPAAEPGDEA